MQRAEVASVSKARPPDVRLGVLNVEGVPDRICFAPFVALLLSALSPQSLRNT